MGGMVQFHVEQSIGLRVQFVEEGFGIFEVGPPAHPDRWRRNDERGLYNEIAAQKGMSCGHLIVTCAVVPPGTTQSSTSSQDLSGLYSAILAATFAVSETRSF